MERGLAHTLHYGGRRVKEDMNKQRKRVLVMKKLTYLSVFVLTLFSFAFAHAQDSGVFWIKTFRPGSADLTDPQIDQAALAKLDSLMQDESVEVTFLGAADGKTWYLHGQALHKDIAEALNDAKRLSRARALQARYGRGTVGITYEEIAGVKVVWRRTRKQTEEIDLTAKPEVENLATKDGVVEPQSEAATPSEPEPGDVSVVNPEPEHLGRWEFNWRLQAGIWSYQSGSNGSLLSPSLALNIIINNTALVIQGGVTPWHVSSPYGNQAESFVYVGIKHMKSERWGFSAGAFRGWEFLTKTDNWSFKATGLAAGVVLNLGIVEFNPALTYTNVNKLSDNSSVWRVGTTLGLNFNIN